MRFRLMVVAFAAGAVPLAAQQRVQLPIEDRAIGLRTQSLFSVGVEEGEPWETFAQVWQVAFDRGGRLYVLDTGNHRVHVFDEAGKFIRSIGRRGNGPGEFQAPLGIAITSSNELVVNDVVRGIQLFSLDGAFLRTVAVEDGSRVVSQIQPHGTDGFFGELGPMHGLGTRFEGAPPPTPPRRIGYVPRSGAARTLYAAPPPQTVEQRTETAPDRGFVAQMPIAFAPRLSWVALPDGRGIAAANGMDYRITLVDDRGTQTRVIERAIASRKVLQSDRDAFMKAAENETPLVVAGPNGPSGDLMREMQKQRLRNMRFAESMPVIQKLAMDPAGRIWVQRSGSRTADDGPIDLVSLDGRYLGTLTGQKIPSAFGPDGRVAYIEKDDLGVVKVAVRKISISS